MILLELSEMVITVIREIPVSSANAIEVLAPRNLKINQGYLKIALI